MTTSDLNIAKRIVSKAKRLSDDIKIMEGTTSTKVIFVLSSGHNFTLFVSDTEQDLTGNLHKMVIEAMKHERADLQREFEQL